MVTQSGQYRSGGKPTCLDLTLCNHEFHPFREGLRVSGREKWLVIRCGGELLRAMCRTSISDRPSRKVGVMAMSANKRRKLLSVLCSSSSDERSHSSATWHGSGRLETENAVCVPVRAVLGIQKHEA